MSGALEVMGPPQQDKLCDEHVQVFLRGPLPLPAAGVGITGDNAPSAVEFPDALAAAQDGLQAVHVSQSVLCIKESFLRAGTGNSDVTNNSSLSFVVKEERHTVSILPIDARL